LLVNVIEFIRMASPQLQIRKLNLRGRTV